MNAGQILRLLNALGIKTPTTTDMAIGALIISLRDWRNELRKSQRRQRRGDVDLGDD